MFLCGFYPAVTAWFSIFTPCCPAIVSATVCFWATVVKAPKPGSEPPIMAIFWHLVYCAVVLKATFIFPGFTRSSDGDNDRDLEQDSTLRNTSSFCLRSRFDNRHWFLFWWLHSLWWALIMLTCVTVIILHLLYGGVFQRLAPFCKLTHFFFFLSVSPYCRDDM